MHIFVYATLFWLVLQTDRRSFWIRFILDILKECNSIRAFQNRFISPFNLPIRVFRCSSVPKHKLKNCTKTSLNNDTLPHYYAYTTYNTKHNTHNTQQKKSADAVGKHCVCKLDPMMMLEYNVCRQCGRSHVHVLCFVVFVCVCVSLAAQMSDEVLLRRAIWATGRSGVLPPLVECDVCVLRYVCMCYIFRFASE